MKGDLSLSCSVSLPLPLTLPLPLPLPLPRGGLGGGGGLGVRSTSSGRGRGKAGSSSISDSPPESKSGSKSIPRTCSPLRVVIVYYTFRVINDSCMYPRILRALRKRVRVARSYRTGFHVIHFIMTSHKLADILAVRAAQ